MYTVSMRSPALKAVSLWEAIHHTYRDISGKPKALMNEVSSGHLHESTVEDIHSIFLELIL